MRTRRLFLEVREAATVVDALADGLFVRNGLGLVMGERLLLALRVQRLGRALEVPVVVVGRRVHRPGTLIGAGVVVRAVDVDHPVLTALRAALKGSADASGNAGAVDVDVNVDVDVLLGALRLPARAAFASVDDAARTLRALLDDGEVALDLGLGFFRGDRLVLDVVAGGAVAVAGVAVVVRGVRIVDDRALTVVGVGDAVVSLQALCGSFAARVPSLPEAWMPLGLPPLVARGALA